MKVDIELKFVEDRIYLNYWDWGRGKDINCQIIDGKIFKFVHSDAENEEKEEITLGKFIEYVRNREEYNNAEFYKPKT